MSVKPSGDVENSHVARDKGGEYPFAVRLAQSRFIIGGRKHVADQITRQRRQHETEMRVARHLGVEVLENPAVQQAVDQRLRIRPVAAVHGPVDDGVLAHLAGDVCQQLQDQGISAEPGGKYLGNRPGYSAMLEELDPRARPQLASGMSRTGSDHDSSGTGSPRPHTTTRSSGMPELNARSFSHDCMEPT